MNKLENFLRKHRIEIFNLLLEIQHLSKIIARCMLLCVMSLSLLWIYGITKNYDLFSNHVQAEPNLLDVIYNMIFIPLQFCIMFYLISVIVRVCSDFITVERGLNENNAGIFIGSALPLKEKGEQDTNSNS